MVVWSLKADFRRGREDRQGHLPHPRVHDAKEGLFARGLGNYRWKAARPLHVALEDSYIRANYGTINKLRKLNGIPFNATGEKICGDGLWCVYRDR